MQSKKQKFDCKKEWWNVLKSINVRGSRMLKWKRESPTQMQKNLPCFLVLEFCKMLMIWVHNIVMHVTY